MSDHCGGYRRPTTKDQHGVSHMIEGTCAHGFFVTPPCYSAEAADRKAPLCCNEDWLERSFEFLLDETGKPVSSTKGEK